jgi:hypothetical protein
MRGEFLLAGGFADSNRIFGFTSAEIGQAIDSGLPLDAASDGDLIYSGSLADLTVNDWGALLATVVYNHDMSVSFTGLKLLPLASQGSGISSGPMSAILDCASDATATVLDIAARDGLLVARVANNDDQHFLGLIKRE